MKQKTWKQIEISRNRRLWFGQVIMPVVTIAGTVLAVSEPARDWVSEKVKTTSEFVDGKVKSSRKKDVK